MFSQGYSSCWSKQLPGDVHTSLRVVYVVTIEKILGIVLGKLYILLSPLRIFSYVTRQSYLLFCKTNLGEKR